MGKCGTSLIDAAQETLVLAFKVADATLLESPEMIQKILSDPAIKKAVESAALQQARELIQKQRGGKAVEESDVKGSAAKVGAAAASAAKGAALGTLEKTAKATPEYKQLEQSLKELECTWKKSALGVFVDKNKGLLIVVGAGMALSGAIVMYHFKAGDVVAGPATDLAKKLVKFSVLGNVEITAKEVTFKPSERLIGTTMLATANWKKIQAKFEAGVTLKDFELNKVSAGAEVSVKIVKDVTSTVSLGYQYQAPSPTGPPQNPHRYDLGLGFTYNGAFGLSGVSVSTMVFGKQDATKTSAGAKAGAAVTIVGGTKKSPQSLKIEAAGSANHVFREVPPAGGTAGPQNEYRATIGIVGHF